MVSSKIKNSLKAGARVVGFITVMTVGLGECGLRLTGFDYPNFFHYDARRGWSHQPGRKGWWRSEGEAYVEINSQGLRDREHSLAKPAGTTRIAIIGDSYPEAFQVPADKAFWAEMERRLQGCARFEGKSVELINFGVSSYGTANEYLTLDDAFRYSPDIVLLAITTGNDLLDNSRKLDPQTGPRPFYRLENGNLVLDSSRNVPPSLSRRAWAWVGDVSRIARLIQRVREVMTVKNARGGKGNATADALYHEPTTPEWRETWDVTEALLTAARNDVVAHGAEFWITTLSNAIQVDIHADKRDAFLREQNLTDLFYPDHRIEQFAKSKAIPAVILAPELFRIAQAEGHCVHGFSNTPPCEGHWNADGHRAAGDILAERICRGADK